MARALDRQPEDRTCLARGDQVAGARPRDGRASRPTGIAATASMTNFRDADESAAATPRSQPRRVAVGGHFAANSFADTSTS